MSDKKTHDIHHQEMAELHRIREATWQSQKSSGRTGTCDFLDLLLRIHEAMLNLNDVQKLASVQKPEDETNVRLHHPVPQSSTPPLGAYAPGPAYSSAPPVVTPAHTVPVPVHPIPPTVHAQEGQKHVYRDDQPKGKKS